MKSAAILMAALLTAVALPVDAGQAAEYGDHIVSHVRIANPTGHSTIVFAAADEDGRIVMTGRIYWNTLFLSDGESEIRYGETDATGNKYIGQGWYRYDLIVKGDTYLFTLNQNDPVELKTKVHATEVTPVPEPWVMQAGPAESVYHSRTRVDDEGGARDETFSRSWQESTWQRVITEGSIDYRNNSIGFQGLGHAFLVPGNTDGLAYLQTPIDGMTRFGAEAGFYVETAMPPHGVVVLAGVRGTDLAPQRQWSLEVTLEPLDPWFWTLDVVTPLGRTPVFAPRSGCCWTDVRVLVDETAGALDVWIDGTHKGQFHGIPTSDRIAVGDIDTFPFSHLGGTLFLDDLALYGVDS